MINYKNRENKENEENEENKYKNKGLSGLANLGNTCFINSCIQILNHSYEFIKFLDKEKYKEYLKNSCDSVLLIEYDELRKLLYSKNCIINPLKFIRIIQEVAKIKKQELFTSYSQNDICEFFMFIMDCFHNSISREVSMSINGNVMNEKDKVAILVYEKIKQMYSNDYSELMTLFYGIQITEIINIENKTLINNIPEPFLILNLSLPEDNKESNLISCLNNYVNGEILENENGYYNEKTGQKENVYSKISFWSFPNILIICLKRFNNSIRKKQNLITFPLNNLDLSEYVIGYNKEQFKYDCYGIANHSGNILGGHYTSFVKNANNNWYHFNDTSVQKVEDLNQIISPKAYCLFYRKIT